MTSSGLRKRILSTLIVSTMILAATSAPSPAAQDAPSMTPEARAARIERELLPGILIPGRPLTGRSLAERMTALKIPGVSIAVINDGRIEWAKGYGVRQAGSASPVTARTLFQAASISKSVAAMGALRLVEQGKLALDEDVNAKLTSWKVPDNEFTKSERVTLRRLLSHTAGLTVHGFGGYPAGTPVPTTVQILDGAKPANSAAVAPNVIPGSLWRYSGGGFTVMQLLVSDVTGKPFPALLSELVLKPVGMADSTYEQPLPPGRGVEAATGHRADGKLLPGLYHTYPEMAAAGLWTTPTDLARYLIEIQKALRGESSVVSAEMARLMTTSVKGGYGLGLSLQGAGPTASFGHGGSNEGFKCQMTAFLDKGQGVVIMTNGDQGARLGAEILRAVARAYGWPAFKPREKTPVPLAPEAVAPLLGRYEMRPGRNISIELEGETLFLIDGKQRIELFPESEVRFFELVEETTLLFQKGADGKVTQLIIDGQIKAPKIADK